MKKRTIFNPATFKAELEAKTRSKASEIEKGQTYILELFFSGKHNASDLDFTKFTLRSLDVLIEELFAITTVADECSFDEEDEENGHLYLTANQGFPVYEINRIYEASRQMLKAKALHLQTEDDFI